MTPSATLSWFILAPWICSHSLSPASSCPGLSPLSSLYSKRLWTAPTIRFSFAGHWPHSSPGRFEPLWAPDWLRRPRQAPHWWKFAHPGRCRAAAELAAHRTSEIEDSQIFQGKLTIIEGVNYSNLLMLWIDLFSAMTEEHFLSR